MASMAQAGIETPTVTLPDETDHKSVTVDFPFSFPYLPLVTLYLFLLDFLLSLLRYG